MSIELLTILMFGGFFALLAFGIPIAWVTLFLAAVFGYILMGDAVVQFMALRTWNIMTSFSLVAIPLFVFMANTLQYSGIAEDLYSAVHRWLGSVRGGLAMASVLVCTVLAAMVGTIGAGITIMGLVALPAMLNRKYQKSLTLGSIIAGGALGTLIPPSISFIIYGLNSGDSIGKLFMGGIGPGLILTSLFIAYIGIRAYLNPKLAPEIPKEQRPPLSEKIAFSRNLVLPILLILAVLGSIYLGVATPGEAAGVGALGALLCAAVRRKLTLTVLKQAVFGSIRTIGVVMWIAFGALAFIGVYLLAGGAQFIGGMLTALELGRWGTLILIQFILIILGMVLDPIGIIFLAVPIFVPVIKALGFNSLWFGILFGMNLQIAYLSPPFGIGMFYLKAVAPPDVTTTDLYKSVWPFMGLQIIGMILVMVFPQIALFIPGKMIK